jgi:hypothetical protein
MPHGALTVEPDGTLRVAPHPDEDTGSRLVLTAPPGSPVLAFHSGEGAQRGHADKLATSYALSSLLELFIQGIGCFE